MPTISVIIPCYNQAKYIAECLDSVLAQTFTDFEVIVVNDGSTDNSQEIVQAYVAKYPQVHLINQENSGISATRNNAMNEASGTYFYPLDGDDKIHPQCLEKLYKTITSTSYRAVGSETMLFGAADNILIQPKLSKYQMYGRHGGCVVSALYYKEDFERFGGYKEEFSRIGGEDMDYWLNYIDNDIPIYRLPEVLFYYRIKDEKSHWNNYSKMELKRRMAHKAKRLAFYHPKMRFWYQLYRMTEGLKKLFYQRKTNPNRCYYKFFGITVYKKYL